MESIVIVEPIHGKDVWCASFQPSSFALGQTKSLWIVNDIEHIHTSRTLSMPSDIMALTRDTDQLITGARNGTVQVFDLRVHLKEAAASCGKETQGQQLLRAGSTVTNVSRIRDWELLVTSISGNMDMYDMRFLRQSLSTTYSKQTPILSFANHFSTISLNLPVTLDPSHDFIFAAGQDCTIRAWSSRTGEQLLSPIPESSPFTSSSSSSRPGEHHLLDVVFKRPVVEMHVQEGGTKRGGGGGGGSKGQLPSLWAASGSSVDRFELGRVREVSVD